MSVAEEALFHGYSRAGESRIESRPCQCGGTVQADPEAPAKGVAQHNSTGRHKAWRAAREGR